VAAAFASPIGGVLFTIEEGVSFYSTSVFWRGFLATCVAVLTLHFLVELTVRHHDAFQRQGSGLCSSAWCGR